MIQSNIECSRKTYDGFYFFFYLGIPAYSPPEYVLQREYFGVPAAVWSLGILMFELVCGMWPFTSKEDITDGHLWFISHLSCGKKI